MIYNADSLPTREQLAGFIINLLDLEMEAKQAYKDKKKDADEIWCSYKTLHRMVYDNAYSILHINDNK